MGQGMISGEHQGELPAWAGHRPVRVGGGVGGTRAGRGGDTGPPCPGLPALRPVIRAHEHTALERTCTQACQGSTPNDATRLSTWGKPGNPVSPTGWHPRRDHERQEDSALPELPCPCLSPQRPPGPGLPCDSLRSAPSSFPRGTVTGAFRTDRHAEFCCAKVRRDDDVFRRTRTCLFGSSGAWCFVADDAVSQV